MILSTTTPLDTLYRHSLTILIVCHLHIFCIGQFSMVIVERAVRRRELELMARPLTQQGIPTIHFHDSSLRFSSMPSLPCHPSHPLI